MSPTVTAGVQTVSRLGRTAAPDDRPGEPRRTVSHTQVAGRARARPVVTLGTSATRSKRAHLAPTAQLRCRDRLAEHRYGTRPVISIVTPEEMRAIDAAAPDPVEVLIARAGAAVARAARRMLGGTYGRRVVVVAGKGNNGNDGRAAAGAAAGLGDEGGRPRRRRRPPRGPLVRSRDRRGLRHRLPRDLGAARRRRSRRAGGRHPEWCRRSDRRGRGAGAPGRPHRHVRGAEAGPPASPRAGSWPARWRWPTSACRLRRRRISWRRPTSPGGCRRGPPTPTSGGPRCGSWRARRACSAPRTWRRERPSEPVPAWCACRRPAWRPIRCSPPRWSAPPVAGEGFAPVILDGLDRFHALVVGPGLGRSDATVEGVRRLVLDAPLPVLVDGDGLFAVHEQLGCVRDRTAPTVLTPHDGEYAVLAGSPPGDDRIAAARRLAAGSRGGGAAEGSGHGGGLTHGRGARRVRRRRAAGHRRDGRRALGHHRRRSSPRVWRRSLPRPSAPGSTARPPSSARPGAWWPATSPTSSPRSWPRCDGDRALGLGRGRPGRRSATTSVGSAPSWPRPTCGRW